MHITISVFGSCLLPLEIDGLETVQKVIEKLSLLVTCDPATVVLYYDNVKLINDYPLNYYGIV